MRFSETYKVKKFRKDDWFDPVLSVDTKLFVDPFLIYSSEVGPFHGSHAEIISFFNDVFSLISKSRGDRSHICWKRAQRLLVFPEAEELCLGYATGNTKGAGAGAGFAKVIADALWEAVDAGIQHFSHFEEVGILREGIGADRISDITANLLRPRLIAYTESICEKHKIPRVAQRFPRGVYSREFERWLPCTAKLPKNQYNDSPILLIPERYLRDLPTITAQAFWDYCYSNENEALREDLGADITRHVDKKTIISFAHKHSDLRDQFINFVEQEDPQPYDYATDQKGLIKWYDATVSHCRRAPLQLHFSSEAEFKGFTKVLLDEFCNYVENNEGWRLLWNDNGVAKSEEAAQLLFLGIVKHYCKANNIDISREVNIGRGPVDFKTSQGNDFRALLELKLAKNSKFWNGLTKQLPKYLQAEEIRIGYFLVVVQSDQDLKRLRSIKSRVSALNKSTNYDISTTIIDARRNPPSASKL